MNESKGTKCNGVAVFKSGPNPQGKSWAGNFCADKEGCGNVDWARSKDKTKDKHEEIMGALRKIYEKLEEIGLNK